MKVELDSQGGVIPKTSSEIKRAEKADLGTLPKGVSASCGTCSFFTDRQGVLGFCSHQKIRMILSKRNCCSFWSNPDYLRYF